MVARCGLLKIPLSLFCELRSHKLFLNDNWAGASPHTPISLIRATKGFAFGNHQLFEKSWAKTFSFVTLPYGCIFYIPDHLATYCKGDHMVFE